MIQIVASSSESDLYSASTPTVVSSADAQDGESGVSWVGGHAMLCCVNFINTADQSSRGRYVIAAHTNGADGRCFDGDSDTGCRDDR
eukprot:SAG11_NODE_29326_length_312_cov_0.699531_1_plen_86_part_01